MATVNFSVPDDVKKAFNEAFAGRNKSAIVAELMMQAVAEREKVQRRAAAIDRLLARREERPAAADEDIQTARSALVYETASRLAVNLSQHLLDTLYHAVERDLRGAVLVTADERYFHEASGWGQIVRLAEYDA